jgi:asparagine synthase (glutamine-hydrolysing)
MEAAGEAPQAGWRGHSDTETLIELIAHKGLEAALDRCVGMFALALWDRETRQLALARDRFGEKPLYYGWAGSAFLFASELKAFARFPGFEPEIDRHSVALYAARNYIPAPRSVYRGFFKLQPGCILRASVGCEPQSEPPPVGVTTGGVSISRYWSYRDVVEAGAADPIGEERDAVDGLEAVLAEAVKSQSIADVPVGAFLSGGVDSSTIVALYQKYSALPVKTYTVGFEEAAFDESTDARRVAAYFGTDHHEQIVTARETREVIPLLPTIYDEPFGDSSQIPTYLVSRFAREDVTVALSGDGGDELFGGYNRYFVTARLWSTLKRVPAPLRAAAAIPLRLVPSAAWDGVANFAMAGRAPPYFGSKAQRAVRGLAAARSLDELFAGLLDEWRGDGTPVIGGEGALASYPIDLDAGVKDDICRLMYGDAISYLPDDILCKVDRATMAVSLEGHAPYLDHRVAAFAARIPIAMKIRGATGKHILRQLLYREAPRELFDRPKAGFGVPVGEWIKGPLREWAEGLLDPARLKAEGWFDPAPIARRWRDHLAGRRDSSSALWSILMFQAWLDAEKGAGVSAAHH